MTDCQSLPARFCERMRTLLGDEADELFAALVQPAPTGLRVNTLKLDSARFRTLAPWPLTPVPWCPTGFVLEGAARPGAHPFHAAGLYYLQDPAAMAVAEALAPQPGEHILDLAAAPGGKATHLVALTGDRGLVVANDTDAGRSRVLASNLERWGAARTLITAERPERLAARWGARFDRVLFDAPCSGESMFGKSVSARTMWREEVVQGCAARQQHALRDAAALVRPGGALVYSTCTFAPEENEHVIAAFLADYPDFELLPVRLPGTAWGRPDWLPPQRYRPDLACAARIWPHRSSGAGHFIALLRRARGEQPSAQVVSPAPAPKHAREMWSAFVADTLPCDPAAAAVLTLVGNRLYATPQDLPPLDGLRVERAGLWLGTLQRNRFEPSHSLALALPPAQNGAYPAQRYLDLAPADERLHRYLQGHPLAEAGEPGWVLLLVAGFPIGWGRRAQNVIKNAYPRGLRRPPD